MDVTDHVERTGLVAEVVEQPLSHDGRGADLRDAVQVVDLAEPLLAQAAQRAAELVVLAPDHVRAEVAVRAGGVALHRHRLGDVEDDRDRQHVVLPRQLDERAACGRLRVRGVDDRETSCIQALAGDVVQDVEGGGARGLVVLVVGHQAAAEVAGDHLERPEVLARERRLARPGHPDEDDEGQLGHSQHRSRRRRALVRHALPPWVKTAIWVGGPTSSSTGPTGAMRTR